MTLDQFWGVIADSRRDFDPNRRNGNMDAQVRRLKQLLRGLPGEEVREFDRIFARLYYDAYRWDLWAAAYIIEGGCSDDNFMDFRNWLISMGREVYESAMADAEYLAEVADGPGVEVCFFEEFSGIATDVLEEKSVPELDEPVAMKHPEEPSGERWEDDDLPRRFPRLWARFANR